MASTMRFTLSQMLIAVAVGTAAVMIFVARLEVYNSRIGELTGRLYELRTDVAEQESDYWFSSTSYMCGQPSMAELQNGASTPPFPIQAPWTLQRVRQELARLQAMQETIAQRRALYLARWGAMSLSLAVATIGFASIRRYCRVSRHERRSP